MCEATERIQVKKIYNMYVEKKTGKNKPERKP